MEIPQKRNFVACGIDDNYVWPLLVMLTSAKVNTSRQFSVILCYDKNFLSLTNISFIIAYLRTISIDFELVELEIQVEARYETYLTSTTYSRIILADNLSAVFLWLDADLICRKGWDDVFEFVPPAKSKVIATGVRDPLVKRWSEDEFSKNQAVQIAQHDYINAGVLLLDSQKWSDLYGVEEWREVLNPAKQLGFQFHDQCVLNYLLKGRIAFLPDEFNYLIRNEDGRIIQDPKIVHFSGWDKPWHYSNYHLWVRSPIKHRDLYREYSVYEIRVLLNILIKNLSLFPRAVKTKSAVGKSSQKVRILSKRIFSSIKFPARVFKKIARMVIK
jgi:lipopolysaccharide biosynthesis glycosyltransferase